MSEGVAEVLFVEIVEKNTTGTYGNTFEYNQRSNHKNPRIGGFVGVDGVKV